MAVMRHQQALDLSNGPGPADGFFDFVEDDAFPIAAFAARAVLAVRWNFAAHDFLGCSDRAFGHVAVVAVEFLALVVALRPLAESPLVFGESGLEVLDVECRARWDAAGLVITDPPESLLVAIVGDFAEVNEFAHLVLQDAIGCLSSRLDVLESDVAGLGVDAEACCALRDGLVPSLQSAAFEFDGWREHGLSVLEFPAVHDEVLVGVALGEGLLAEVLVRHE